MSERRKGRERKKERESERLGAREIRRVRYKQIVWVRER